MTYFIYVFRSYRNFPFIGIFIVRTPKLIVLNPTLVKEVLIKNFKCFTDNEISDFVHVTSDPILANTPFFMKGQWWKDTRADITPAFTTSRVSIKRMAGNTVQRLKKISDDV